MNEGQHLIFCPNEFRLVGAAEHERGKGCNTRALGRPRASPAKDPRGKGGGSTQKGGRNGQSRKINWSGCDRARNNPAKVFIFSMFISRGSRFGWVGRMATLSFSLHGDSTSSQSQKARMGISPKMASQGVCVSVCVCVFKRLNN